MSPFSSRAEPWSTVLDEFPDGVIVVGADAHVLYVNPQIEKLLGRDDMIGLRLDKVMTFEDDRGRSWCEVCRPYDGLAIRTRLVERTWFTPDGTEVLITASLIRVRPSGPIKQVIIAIRDGRQQAHRDRERSDMVATLAHELRSPLTGIKGFSATLMEHWQEFDDDQRQFMLHTVDAESDRLARLIGELLDAARIDTGRLKLSVAPVELVDVAGHVLSLAFAGRPEIPEVVVTGDVPVIYGDVDRITQIMLNLVENAMRHGGGLSQLIVGPDGDGVCIEVLDDGPGIAHDLKHRVFGRFWKSGSHAGSGLGMFIVAGIVDGHGGTISLDDRPEGGTAVRVWFPINEPELLSDKLR